MEKQINIRHPQLLFVFDIANETNWRDGLWSALKLLQKDFDITYWNLAHGRQMPVSLDHFDFILGWSSFDGEISHLMRKLKQPHGLCIGGYTFEPHSINHYDVLFYETEWYANAELNHRHKNVVHAFGINTDIFHPIEINDHPWLYPEIFDYLTIGSFSAWKRQAYLLKKEGYRMAVGHIQQTDEAFDIMSQLIAYGCGVMGEVSPEFLCKLINASKTVYLPATITGGSERSVLEARACGVSVEIEEDNPKLKELLTSPIWDHRYYADALRKGILSVIG